MSFRISDSNTNSTFTKRINAQRSQIGVLQERLASGKRINRPSDDPIGAEAVINIRTSQKEIEQFQRNAQTANQKLTAADTTLGSYENILDRVKTLVTQGLSGTATQPAKNAIATELESLRERVLNTANSQYNGEYLFGGSRQNAPPFDPTTAAPAATPANAQYIQIEPGANAIAVGVTAETVFGDANSDIFTDLNNAIAALRGTGDETADRTTLENTFSRLSIYSDLAGIAHSRIGANMNITEISNERLSNDFLSLDTRAGEIENADFVGTVVELNETQTALDATLQVVAKGRRSLFDFLG